MLSRKGKKWGLLHGVASSIYLNNKCGYIAGFAGGMGRATVLW